jgi:hypothetical protein
VVGILRQHVAVAAGQDHGQAGIALADDTGELDAVIPGMITSENTRSAENSSSARIASAASALATRRTV